MTLPGPSLLLVAALILVGLVAIGVSVRRALREDQEFLRPPERPITPADWGRR